MSHGPVDVFAGRSGEVILVQVKSGSARIGKEELERLVTWAEAFNANAEVWYFKRRRKPKRVVVYKNHKEEGLSQISN
jgi:Holliday junction resolvase